MKKLIVLGVLLLALIAVSGLTLVDLYLGPSTADVELAKSSPASPPAGTAPRASHGQRRSAPN